jgi:hypothetical protein
MSCGSSFFISTHFNMEQEKILSTLTEKLGQTSLSQKTIGDYVAQNLPTEGVEPDDAYWNKHVAILTSLNGNFSASVAAQVNEFKKNYKPDNNNPPQPNPNNDKGEQSALEKRLEQLENQLKERDAKFTREQLTNNVIAQADSLKVANKAIWEDAVKTVEVEEKDTTDTLLTKAKAAYERLLKRYVGDGATPYGGSNNGGGTSKEAAQQQQARREAFKAKMRQSGKLPKSEK